MAPQVVGVPSLRKTHALSCRTTTRTAGFSTAVGETHADNASEHAKNKVNPQEFRIIFISDNFIFIDRTITNHAQEIQSSLYSIHTGDHVYGKQTECAIGCASRLAEVFDGGKTRLNAAEIAEARGLQAPSVAKILSVLSKAGIVDGSRGPGGGYALSRPPKQIVLRDIFELFERSDPSNNCPFGGGVCGAGAPCAMHQELVDVQKHLDNFLDKTTLEPFRVAYQELGHRPVPSGTRPIVSKRESFRARKRARS